MDTRECRGPLERVSSFGEHVEAGRKQTAPWRIAELLMESGPASRARISKVTGYSRPTVSEAVEHLLRHKIVQESEKVATGGRRATLLEMSSVLGCVAAIDMSPSKARFNLFDLHGNRLAALDESMPNRSIERFLTGRLAQIAREHHAPILTVAVGVPGSVDRLTGTVELAPGLGESHTFSAERCSSLLGIPVMLENDVNAAALGELSFRRQSVRSFAFLTIGTGIGAGIVLDGHLYRGVRGAAGEVGYMLLDPIWRRPGAAEFGCFERVASARGLERSMRAQGRDLDAQGVVEAACKRDPQALQVVREFAHWIAMATANLHVLLDPEMIIFGKGMSGKETGSFLLGLIKSELSTLIPHQPVLERSLLGEEATLVGLSKLALSGARERLLRDIAS